MPLPTGARPTNDLAWRQVLAWGGIIAIVAPVAITVAAMLMITLTLLLGFTLGRPQLDRIRLLKRRKLSGSALRPNRRPRTNLE